MSAQSTEAAAQSTHRGRPLGPGLYLVATPIGSADDVTLRALSVLREADLLAAEDTRRARKLMELHGVRLDGRRMLAYHDHNGPTQRPAILDALAAGQSVAYLSDAGTPLIADPGYRLVEAAQAAGHRVHAVPGASAVLAALSVAGLPTDRFFFAGFPPVKPGAQARSFAELAPLPASLVFFEAPRRVAATLAAMAEIFGPERPVALCRELTKRHEEVRRGNLGALAAALAAEPVPRGEIVLVLGPPLPVAAAEADIDTALRAALATMSAKDAVRAVADATGAPRRMVYARALEIGRE
ncbi:MAG: 16S rRNA (cytidine(1402)-2'-O)-methyltransferase [Pseudomonadota bacterium]